VLDCIQNIICRGFWYNN